MTDGPRVLPIAATWVTGNYFPVLGVTPVLGRQLTPEDDAVGAAPVMVISYALWQNRFAGVAAVIGQRLQLNAKQYTIVGVMPLGFEYPRHTDTWLPVLSTYPATQEPGAFGPDVMLFDAIGRFRHGISQTAATNELTAFLRDTDARRPASMRGTIAIVTSFMDRMSGDVRGTLLACSVAVGLLLLVACVNVANLLLIRGALRTQELAIRSALGAGRTRLIRQLVTEASLIASAGGIAAIALAWLAIRAIRVFAPAGIPHRELIVIDTRVLLVALAVTILATITSGLLPAILGARGDLGLWLRGGSAMSGVHRHSHLLRLGLVVGQIAMAVVVLISAGLVTRSLRELQQVDMGFDGTQLSIVETLLPPDAALTHDAQLAVQEAMLARVASIPGVVAATALPKPPYAAEGGWIAMYSADGQDEAERAGNPAVDFEVVANNYFGALGVHMVAGRSFDASDRHGAQPVAIVSASVARKTWPGGDPIGRRIKLGAADGRGPWMTVIGVAAETRYRDLTTTRPTLYLPAKQFAGPVPMTLAVRTRADAGDLRAAIRGALADAHPALRVVTEASLDERLSAPLARPRFGAVLFGTFAVITLVLCVIGIYGAIAATVRERQLEFGIRLALGERPASIRARILRVGGMLTLGGAVLGVVGALIGTRLLQTLLFGVSAVDPLTYATVVVTVVGVAAVACWVPAQRAARVNPIDVLRGSST